MSSVVFYHLSGWSLPEILLILLIFQLSFLRNTARHNKNFVNLCIKKSWFQMFFTVSINKQAQVKSRVEVKSKRVRIQLLHRCFSHTVSDAYWRPHLSGWTLCGMAFQTSALWGQSDSQIPYLRITWAEERWSQNEATEMMAEWTELY